MKPNISTENYKQLSEEIAPPTKSFKTIPTAFAVGGLICLIGECFNSLYSMWIDDSKTVATAVSITLVFLSALFTGLGWYSRIAKHAGAGTLVPITGFANSVVSPAIEFKTEGMILGLGAKIFIICGPVILYSTVASVIYGLIYYFFLR